MEIDITRFFLEADPFLYSHSIAEGGQNAEEDTWNTAVADAPEWNHLDTDDKRDAFRDYVRDFGAWSEEEIAAWTDAEVEALFLQMVSGDIREAGLTDIDDDDQWTEYESNTEKGRIAGNIFRADGKVYYSISR